MNGLRLERPAEGVARIVIDRPGRRNALDDNLLLRVLPDTIQEVAEDDSVGAVIVTGSDPDFCAGADLECEGLDQPTPTASERYMRQSHRTPVLLRSMPKPVIAAVSGNAVGAGMSLALACDMRLVAPTARFIAPFIKMGLAPDYGTSFLLPTVTTPAFALEMLLTCRPVGAEEAVKVGMASRVCEDVQGEALAMATTMAKNSRYASGVTKSLVHKAREREMHSAIYDNEIRAVSIALHGEDFAAALEAWRSQILKSK